jgi:hypothetical protein
MPAGFISQRQDLAAHLGASATEDGGEIAPPCVYVRDTCSQALDAAWGGVLGEVEIRQLSRHAARCLDCMEEFIGLIQAATTASPSGTVTGPGSGRATPVRPEAGVSRSG